MADRAVERPPITLDDLLAMGSEVRVEIMDGEMIEMVSGGMTNGIIGGLVVTHLNLYLFEHPIGVVAQDNVTYLMFSIERRLKNSFVPDVSFVFHENIPQGWNSSTPHPGVPDLAVEIVSPGDDPEFVLRKRQIYLEKGTREVWIIYPNIRELHQCTLNGVKIYSRLEEIILTDLFPSLTGLSLAKIFNLPVWAIKTHEDEAE